MFRERLIASIILIPLVLLAIYFSNQTIFSFVVVLLLLGLCSEWFQLIPIDKNWVKVDYFLIILILTWLFQFHSQIWLFIEMILWLFIVAAILSYPESLAVWGKKWIVALVGLLVLPLFALSLIEIHGLPNGKSLFIYLLFLVWSADIGAYLFGKKWGKHKLIPNVSPGKTKEGLLGGTLSSLIIAGIGYIYFKPQFTFNWFVIAFCLSFVAMVGDLFISILKRRVKIKDTGNIIPGHGGILDRLDSLLSAAPFFLLSLIYLSMGI